MTGKPTPEQIAEWIRDPRNRDDVADVLRREARAGAPWLREFVERENRARSIGRVW